MKKVYCTNKDCTGCENSVCIRSCILIGESGMDAVCENYECYSDTKEYQDEYFIAVKAKGGKIAKVKKQGKRIEYKGFVFYTENDFRYPELATVTEERTGFHCGYFQNLIEDCDIWESFIEAAKTQKDVQSFPLAVWDEKCREYVIVDGDTE